ncbi:uncharacterized protein [Onthophagus taurus]|uniref:uncharacterized protein n=1 Tax=Onthophagus taurus TaxID=166361 RepID=UPI0039BE1A65
MISILIMLLLINNIIQDINGLFRGNIMKQIKGKAMDYYKSKFGTKGLNFMGYELSEYPGANDIYRKENIAKWEEYYQCLNMQNEALGSLRNFVPEAILAYESGYVKFDCKICLSPESQHNLESVEWDFGKEDDNYLIEIELTEHVIIAPEDKSLSIYNLQLEHTGQYVCRLGQTITAPIYLTVIKGDNLTEVHGKNAEKGPFPQRPKTITGSDALYLDTVWSPWSQCNRCHKVGKRHRHGYCIIKYGEEDVERMRRDEENITQTATTIPFNNNSGYFSEGPISKENTSACVNCKEIELDLLKIFEGGMPCESHILPSSFKNLPDVKERTGEIMVGYCKVPCPKSQIFEVKDKSGKIIESANNSAGIYSMLQPIPPPVPPLVQQVQYAAKGNDITIGCPGNLNSDAPIIWQIAGKNVVPELLKQDSLGRIFITLSDKIHIRQAKISDTNTYSCWQNDEVAGVIRLVVEKKIEMNFNHHIMLFGIIIILSTFLLVFMKAFFGRKYAKT